MSKSPTPVIGSLDSGILAPIARTVQFFSNDNGMPKSALRDMTGYELSDLADDVTGTSGAEAILAFAGNDKVSAGAGDDYVDGGDGNDVIYGGEGNDHLKGGNGDDSLFGDAGDDVLDGGYGFDMMRGGVGNDMYFVWDSGDFVIEQANEGNDTVVSGLATLTLMQNVENLVASDALLAPANFTGNALNNRLVGTAFNDTLSGLAGNDVLDGRAGADTMVGGTGDDTYYVDNAGDVTKELAGEGNDTVFATVNHTMGLHVETLRFVNSASAPQQGFIGYGNGQDNLIVGGDGADALYGMTGNDILDGGLGVDLMDGGLGNDIFIAQAGDKIVELAGQGIDTVRTNEASWTLEANVENLEFTVRIDTTGQAVGNSAFTGTGNGLANVITGNFGNDALFGLGGDDMLFGAGGSDHLNGGTGNDTLDGGTGIDQMFGREGNDTYIVDDANDVVIEYAGEGIDTIRTALSTYSLGSEVENLVYTGSGSFQGTGNARANTIEGGAGNDMLFGGAGDDRLQGGAGSDLLDGGTGADFMSGGNGGDRYIVDSTGDVIDEALSYTGTDTVVTGLASYAMASGVEDLEFTGAQAHVGDGNFLNNRMTGNAGNDVLRGYQGNDVLLGGAGNDVMEGGAGSDGLVGGTGADTFRFGTADIGGSDRVWDFVRGEDLIDLRSIDANTALRGDQAMLWMGSGAFQGNGVGSVRYFQSGGQQSFLQVDANGDGVSDFSVEFMNGVNLSASDFLL